MSKDQEIDLSTTAASNTDFGGIGVGEGMPPSDVNNAMRYLAKMRADAVTRHVAKSAGSYTALKADHNQFWRCTGAVTINLTAAATLTSGWCLWVRAHGGAVTIDPNGPEQIDGGASSLVIPDGMTVRVICTGSAFFTWGYNVAPTLVQPTITLKQSAAPSPTAEGDLQWDTNDDAIVVGTGSTQKVFRANGWENVFDGTTSGSATKGFTDLSAYRELRLWGRISMATDGANLILRSSINNGSSYDSGVADYNETMMFNTTTTAVATATTTNGVRLDGNTGIGNAADEFIDFEVHVREWNQTSQCNFNYCSFFRNTAGAARAVTRADTQRAATTARDALLITSTGGNISGRLVLEGRRG